MPCTVATTFAEPHAGQSGGPLASLRILVATGVIQFVCFLFQAKRATRARSSNGSAHFPRDFDEQFRFCICQLAGDRHQAAVRR